MQSRLFPSRRFVTSLLRPIGLLVALLGLNPFAQAGTLGANFNQFFHQLDTNDLTRCKATTIRGFVDYYAFKSGAKDIFNDADLQSLHDAHVAGYTTVVNIK